MRTNELKLGPDKREVHLVCQRTDQGTGMEPGLLKIPKWFGISGLGRTPSSDANCPSYSFLSGWAAEDFEPKRGPEGKDKDPGLLGSGSILLE